MKKIAILQSNYIPWKGYFDIINSADEFILYDTAQYTKNDWRNRNIIKTFQGKNWITIPVKHSISQKINEIKIHDKKWNIKHWKTLSANYSNAKYFGYYKELFENLYLNITETFLSKINYLFITEITKILNINTKISWSTDYIIEGERSEKLVNICKQAGANEYISGPTAKCYLNESLFEKENIKVTWFDYSDYPEYSQLFPPFEHGVSILDLIFNEGQNAPKFMKSFHTKS
ncbi:MAG TPA: hypothetical protein ENN45_04525 [Bacteroidetes bacterium]|nr:hypothetical protein [Bacteroidota bacterium]